MSEISILLVGNTDRSEFRAARKRLDALGRVTAVPDAESAAAALAAAEMVPAVIVVAQAFPGQFPQQAIDRQRRLAPLARVLGLLGSWCEGEVRTGQPWPAAMRIYWHQWPARCGAEFARLSGGQCPAFGLPVTATDEERLLSSAQSPRSALPGVTAIYSTSPQMHEWLSAACRRCGCATVWLRPPQIVKIEGAAAVIFDGTDFSERQLCHFVHQLWIKNHRVPADLIRVGIGLGERDDLCENLVCRDALVKAVPDRLGNVIDNSLLSLGIPRSGAGLRHVVLAAIDSTAHSIVCGLHLGHGVERTCDRGHHLLGKSVDGVRDFRHFSHAVKQGHRRKTGNSLLSIVHTCPQ